LLRQSIASATLLKSRAPAARHPVGAVSRGASLALIGIGSLSRGTVMDFGVGGGSRVGRQMTSGRSANNAARI